MLSSDAAPVPLTAAPAAPAAPRRSGEVGGAVGGAVGGDLDGDFDALVLATGPRFHRAALLLTGGDHHLAEDLLQTTYAKVFSHWRRVSRADDPVAYARTVLTRTYLSHRRLRRSRERPTADLPEPPGVDHDPTARLDLLAALARLGPRDRAVVVSRYWFDRSVADVAAELGMTDVAVRAAARRALARLRAHLTDAHPDCDTDTGGPA